MSTTDASPSVVVDRWSNGLVIAFATSGSLVAWTAHLLALSSLVRLSQRHHGVVWIMHALTLALAFVALAAIAVSWRMATTSGASEADAPPAGRRAFLGWLGVLMGAVNLLLIVLEGIYVVVIKGNG